MTSSRSRLRCWPRSWGLVTARNGHFTPPVAAVLATKVLWFGCAVAALFARDQPGLAITFAALVLINLGVATADRTPVARTAS